MGQIPRRAEKSQPHHDLICRLPRFWPSATLGANYGAGLISKIKVCSDVHSYMPQYSLYTCGHYQYQVHNNYVPINSMVVANLKHFIATSHRSFIIYHYYNKTLYN